MAICCGSDYDKPSFELIMWTLCWHFPSEWSSRLWVRDGTWSGLVHGQQYAVQCHMQQQPGRSPQTVVKHCLIPPWAIPLEEWANHIQHSLIHSLNPFPSMDIINLYAHPAVTSLTELAELQLPAPPDLAQLVSVLRWEWSGPLLEATERPKEMGTRVQSKLPMYWWV